MDGNDVVRGRMSGYEGRMSGGRAGCPGSGSVDELEELRVEEQNSGQNSGDFVDGNWGKDGGKLDLPTTHEIHGSNPTKLHHTNKSRKKLGAIFVGNFRIRDKINKTRLETQRGGSKIMINMALDTKMM